MIRAAVVGLGWWGKILARELVNSGRFQVTRLIDVRDGAHRGMELPAPARFTTRLEDALEDPNVDAVVLATPHGEHDRQIAAAAAAGKHVFAEKPLSLTARGARASIDACARAGVVLAVGHERRYEPPMQRMLEMARTGTLGRLMLVEANFSHDKFLALAADNWRLSPAQAPAAGMTATGIHLIDLAVELLGPVQEVYARSATLASSFPAGDCVSALMLHASGAHSSVNVILTTPFISFFRLFGDLGWIEVRDKAHLEAPEGWILTHCDKSGRPVQHNFPVATPVRDNLLAFADAIEGKAPYPIGAQAQYNTIAALEMVFRSVTRGMPVRAASLAD